MIRSSVVWLLFAVLSLLCLSNCDPLTKHENGNRISECGKSSTIKVFRGEQIAQEKAPWSVFILYHNQAGNSATVCTGTVVSSRHILTATHCFATLSDNGWLEATKELDKKNCKDGHYILEDEALLSKMFIHSNGKPVARSPERVTLINGCEKIALKPKQSKQYEYEDYAIIELYEDLELSAIKMACVPHDATPVAVDTALEYSGFGLNPADGDKMDTGTLRHETIKVKDSSMYGLNQQRLFLAVDTTKKTIACQGDSGGGAVAEMGGKVTVVGVLSQTNCLKNNGVGSDPMELYSSVGYYDNINCKIMGVCDDVNYTAHHDEGYVRKPKPKRVFTTPAPKLVVRDQNGRILSDEEAQKVREEVENGGGSGGSYYSKSGNSKKYTITIIVMGVLFFVF